MWRRPCRRFLDQTARLTLLGCVIGLAAGFALTRIAEGILFVKVGSLVPRRTLQCSRNMPNAPFEAPEPNARQAGPRAKEETAGLANRVRSDMTRNRLERTRTRSSLTRSLQRIAAGLLANGFTRSSGVTDFFRDVSSREYVLTAFGWQDPTRVARLSVAILTSSQTLVNKADCRGELSFREFSSEAPQTFAFIAAAGGAGGRKTRAVMEFVIQYHEQRDKCAVWHEDMSRDKSHFRTGGTQVFVGRPSVEVEWLNQTSCSRLLIAPHFSRRRPNGLWIISRAPSHPLKKAFGESRAYYVKIEDRPLIVEEIEDWRRIHSVELFRLRRDAEKTAIEERAGLKEAGVEQVLLLSEQDSCKLTLLDKFVS